MGAKGLKVLVVDASLVFREAIARELVKFLPHGSEVEKAAEPLTARTKIALFKPDVMLLDIGKSTASGFQFLRRLLAYHPLPTIVISEEPRNSADAFAAGAVDFVLKPSESQKLEQKFISDIALRIRAASQRKVFVKPESEAPKLGSSKPSILEQKIDSANNVKPTSYNSFGFSSLHARQEETENKTPAFPSRNSSAFNSPAAAKAQTADLPKPEPVGERLRSAADVASMYLSKFDITQKETQVTTSGVNVGYGSVFVRRPSPFEKETPAINKPDAETAEPKISTSGVNVGQGSVFVRRTPLTDKLVPEPKEPRLSASGFSVGQGSVFVHRASEAEKPEPAEQGPKVSTSGVSVGQGSVFVRRTPEAVPSSAVVSAVMPPRFQPHDKTKKRTLIAMGASTGGTVALTNVLTKLVPPLPPIVIVQHIPPHFSRLFAERLDEECALTVHEARDGMTIEANHVYIAPGGKHMRLKPAGINAFSLDCAPGPLVNCVCPSVDVLFDTVAELIGDTAIGVILTGIGRDGADGLLKMRMTGAATIGQDAKSSAIYGMPRAAWEAGAVEQQLTLDDIAKAVMDVAWNKE